MGVLIAVKYSHCQSVDGWCSRFVALCLKGSYVKRFWSFNHKSRTLPKWLVKPGMGFKSFNTARRTIKGYEIMHMMKKGQVKKVEKGAVRIRVKFIAEIFGVVA